MIDHKASPIPTHCAEGDVAAADAGETDGSRPVLSTVLEGLMWVRYTY